MTDAERNAYDDHPMDGVCECECHYPCPTCGDHVAGQLVSLMQQQHVLRKLVQRVVDGGTDESSSDLLHEWICDLYDRAVAALDEADGWRSRQEQRRPLLSDGFGRGPSSDGLDEVRALRRTP